MKILVVAHDDPERKTTWSGVPSRVVQELRRQGHCVIGSGYEPVWWIAPIRIFYNRIVRKMVPGWGWRMFACTLLGIGLNSLWLRGVCRRERPDLVVALTFGLDAKIVGCPIVLIHDWTNGYLRAIFQERQVNAVERKFDETIFRVMRRAKKVVSLYPLSARYIANAVGNKVAFICNPVNVEGEVDFEASVEEGVKSKHILVVGGSTYQANVETVIQAADRLKDREIVVDVVGRESAMTKAAFCQVNFYGYLNQDRPNERALYDRLFREARCFVNVRRGWCGGSSIAEALFRGVPAIVSRQAEIQTLYPHAIVCEPENPEALAHVLTRLMTIISPDEYRAICREANAGVKDDTYANFIRAILDGEA